MSGRILLIEGMVNQRILLAGLLRRARHRVTATADLETARQAFAAEAPDLVILGSGSGETAAAAGQDFANSAPVLVLDPAATPERRLDALRAGVCDLLPRTVDAHYLVARVRNLLRDGDIQRERTRRARAAAAFGLSEAPADFLGAPRRVVMVTPDGASPGLSAGAGLSCLSLDDALGGEAVLPVEAFCLPALGPNRECLLDALPDLRDRSHARHAATLVLHDPSDTAAAVLALNLGAGDVMPSDGSDAELSHRLGVLLARKAQRDALRQSSEASMLLAVTDPLTGAFNRRYARTYLAETAAAAQSSDRPFAVFVMDVDHFKHINDRWGHEAGDHVLRAIVDRARDGLRSSDLIARVGGEEFLVILPETSETDAVATAERVRAIIAATPVEVSAGRVEITVSVGVDVIDPADPRIPSVDAVVRRADAALYDAKDAGRNRVAVAF